MTVAANEKQPVHLEQQNGQTQKQQQQQQQQQQLPSSSRKAKSHDEVDDEPFKRHMIDDATRALGVMKVDDQESTHYLGASHWVAVGLSEIAEFRTFLRDNVEELECEAREKRNLLSTTPINSMSLLRGTAPPISKDEVLSWVPPRLIADDLVTRYFELNNPTSVVIHKATFYQEYAEFWLNPSQASYTWLAYFFSMLRIAEVRKETDDISTDLSPDHFDLVALYKRLTIQCLVVTDYTKATTYTLRAFLFYLEAEWLVSQDSTIEISIVIGMIVRLAMHMGIHREWKAHTDLSPFQAEMRRRLWTAFHCMDIMYSFQLSLPPIVRQEDCDCASPRNIRDEDFSKDSVELPPPRPLTEVTEVSYMIAKKQLAFVLDQVLKATEHNGEISRDEVRKLEELMLTSRNSLPPYLQMTFAGKTAAIPQHIQKQRLSLDRLSQLAQCMLYRKFLSRAHQDEKLMHYRRSCIDAALNLLSHQAEIYLSWGADVDRPTSIRKRHVYSLTSQDFYAAGMAIAVDLHYGITAEPKAPKASDVRLWGFDRRPEMIAALERSIEFWRIAKSDSIEAAKAWGLFSFMVKRVKDVLESDNTKSSNDSETSDTSADRSDHLSRGDEAAQAGLEFDWVMWTKKNRKQI